MSAASFAVPAAESAACAAAFAAAAAACAAPGFGGFTVTSDFFGGAIAVAASFGIFTSLFGATARSGRLTGGAFQLS